MSAKLCFLVSLALLFHSTIARNSPSISTNVVNAYSTFNATRNYTHVCDPSRFSDLGLNIKHFAFCDSSLSYDVRVKDLIDRMTLNEKSAQIGDTAYGVPRIGLPKYEWWSEALHGVSNVGQSGSVASYFDDVVPGATSFPTVILTTASFNQTLWKTVGQAVSTEARAMYNLGHAGLTFWSPNINVVRDPRWGRAQETPGEDPFVVGEYAVNYVRGLQDVEGTENTADLNSRPLKVGACCKHYAAYDVDNWLGVDRYHFDARVTEQDMQETFLRPFEMCVKEGDVTSIMCSYNKVNGIPTCADPKLLKDTVRGEWNLHGYIVSDCDSIEVMLHGQKWLNDEPEDAVAQALKAGLDLDCGNFYTNFANSSVRMGKVKEAEIDNALKNLYTVLMRLGFFDGSPKFENLGKPDVCSNEHIELATEAARQGIVLLKNDAETLPLSSEKIKTIAVIGPHANATSAMIGNYAGVPCKYTSPIDGLSRFGEVKYEMGCDGVLCKNDTLIYPAMRAASKTDATILFVGLDLSVEAESLDRVDLLLPGYQSQLISQVAQVSKGPVVVVVMSAGGVDISFAKNDPNIHSIIWAGYPGEEGGHAIADVVFGRYNPGGRLPLTWHENDYVYMLPMTSMRLRPVDSLGYPGRTYKFFNGSTVYPFGYGLSYTNFTYKPVSTKNKLNIRLNQFQHCKDLEYRDGFYKPSCPAVLIDDLKCDSHNMELAIEVANTGKRDGSDVVMVYWSGPSGIAEAPIKQLVAFKRVLVKAGRSEKLKLELNGCKSFGIVDYSGSKLLPSGGGKIEIGDGLLTIPLQIDFHRGAL
ncbi:beta-xylosidase/alpha-L-arabinofuranosidase 1-like [Sesamum indicum]|uniref:Beta-xylosidase/alpha-L-arabinofuranosidase 1-like n=1 Tax=Sesamum indicum TaxID=4182 RepID=A0A6I9U731_SESIN|nr:beta-xylosidase/alpha-L-arabinofuranosidase 1-like [Sesamum indicum]